MGYTYDTGMLLAGERGQRRVWLLHRQALARGVAVAVPAGVLAQAWRGGPQPMLSRFLQGCGVDALDEGEARSAGALCGLARTSDTTDAAVVLGALRRGDVVFTSDPEDLAILAGAAGQALTVRRI